MGPNSSGVPNTSRGFPNSPGGPKLEIDIICKINFLAMLEEAIFVAVYCVYFVHDN